MRRALFASFLVAGVIPACGANKQADEKAGAEAATKTDEKAPATGDEKAGEPAATKLEPAPPLTDEEKRLIEADPATLSPEDRRLRSYALRKKIMQNPDSDAAKAIQEGVDAIERGELQVPEHLMKEGAETKSASSGPMLSAPAPKQESTGLQK